MNTFKNVKVMAFLILLSSFSLKGLASDNDSIALYGYKNTIRWNITPMFVVGPKSIVLGYERIINPSQSFSINIGYLEKAPMKDKDGNPVSFFDQSAKGGYDVSGDYRFYFKNRNKNIAPDGIYWGPYFSLIGIGQDATLNILDNGSIKNQISYQGRFNMYSFGVQLGYQFVIKKRFIIDLLLMGPSYTRYNMQLKLQYDQAIDPDDPFYADLWELIKESSPFMAELLKVDSFDASGRVKFGYFGFRYGVQLGYRF